MPSVTDPSDDAASTSETTTFGNAFAAIARGDTVGVQSYLLDVGAAAQVESTRTSCRAHWIPLDANNRPRLSQLTDRLAETVIDFCIPRSRILVAQNCLEDTGSSHLIVRLDSEARALFSRIENSGEGGELLLYFLMETYLKIPQIFCKMSAKTNTNMHIHGVDGVHALALEDGGLAVYWGESKVYGDFPSALDACMESLKPYLEDAGGGPLERDLNLVRHNLDTGDRALSLQLVKYFDNDEAQARKLEYRAACLLGFSHDNYASPFEDDGVTVKDEVAALLSEWQAKVGAKVANKGIDQFHIEVFCVPMPSADEFRASMRKSLGISS